VKGHRICYEIFDTVISTCNGYGFPENETKAVTNPSKLTEIATFPALDVVLRTSAASASVAISRKTKLLLHLSHFQVSGASCLFRGIGAAPRQQVLFVTNSARIYFCCDRSRRQTCRGRAVQWQGATGDGPRSTEMGVVSSLLYQLWSFLVDDRRADRILTYQEGRAYSGAWVYYYYTWFCLQQMAQSKFILLTVPSGQFLVQ